jgi:hypothetical protein
MMGGALPPNDDIVDLCPDLRHSPGPDAGLKGLLQCLPDTPQGEQLSVRLASLNNIIYSP